MAEEGTVSDNRSASLAYPQKPSAPCPSRRGSCRDAPETRARDERKQPHNDVYTQCFPQVQKERGGGGGGEI